MSQTTLVSLLEALLNDDDLNDEVSEQRARNHRYYTLRPLGNEQKGRNHYVAPVVLDAVEHKKSVFATAYLSGRDPIKFKDCHYPHEAEAKTQYVRRQLNKNKYHRLFRDGWHNAFVAKKMVVLCDWAVEPDEQVINLNMTPAPMLNQMLQQYQGQIVDMDRSQLQVRTMPTPQGPVPVYTGPLTLYLEEGFNELTLVRPECWRRDPEASNIDESLWASYEREVARGMLIEEGFSADQVNDIQAEWSPKTRDEDSARRAHDGGQARWRLRENRARSQETVVVHRTWVWLSDDDEVWSDVSVDFEPQGYALYEVYWTKGEVLRRRDQLDEQGEIIQEGAAAIRRVDSIPAFEWVELPIAHADEGMCTADVMSGHQKVESTMKRLVLDNNQMRNNPDKMIMLGALKRPADVQSSSIGKNIFVRRENAIMPVPAADLDPSTGLVLQMLANDGERRSGTAEVSKGMSTDAVRYQNADSLIERMQSRGDMRTAMAVNDHAWTFWVPLMQHMVRNAMENDQSVDMMEIAGQQVPIAPSQWRDDNLEMEVDEALSPEQAIKLTQGFLTMHSIQSQDPKMQLSYGPEQAHALFDRVYELMGVSDTGAYMLAPSSQQYAQKAQQQAQQAQAQQQQQQQLQGFQMQMMQSQDQREWSKFQWGQTDDMADNTRADRKQRFDEWQSRQELQLEREQNRPVSVS